MSRGSIAAALALLVASTIAATALAGAQAPQAFAQRPACTDVALGFLGPLTGSAGSLAREQLTWLRFGVRRYNRANGTQFAVVAADTRRKAAVVRAQTKKLIRNRSVLATVAGGAESQAVRMSGKLLARAKLASVSGSATAVELTERRPYGTFFRVVPNDGVQGPDIVDFVSGRMGAKNVVVIDSQEEESLQLAATIAEGLRDRGVTVARDGVPSGETDFTPTVMTIDANAEVVVFATRSPSAANTLSNQLREQAKKAIVFGTSGAYSPAQFKPRSGYVSVFAPDLRFDPSAKALLRDYRAFAKRDSGGPFGPATYMAGWVAMAAIEKACRNDVATRSEVVDRVESASVPSIIGPRIRFDRNGDLRGGGSFVIYRIKDGKYAPVAP